MKLASLVILDLKQPFFKFHFNSKEGFFLAKRKGEANTVIHKLQCMTGFNRSSLSDGGALTSKPVRLFCTRSVLYHDFCVVLSRCWCMCAQRKHVWLY